MLLINDLDPEFIGFGLLNIRWYGLMFLVGIVLAYFTIYHAFKGRGFKTEHLDSLVIFLFFGLLIGARVGEIVFYEPGYYFSHPAEMIKIWKGGLASHGATIGLLVSYLLWLWKYKIRFSKYIDQLILGFPIVAGFVRIGNYFNSEIVGKPTGGDAGVIFSRLGEDFPRHPAQLYEAALSFVIFFIMIFIYKKWAKKLPSLFFLFFYMLTYFGGRFVLEYWKDLHVLPEGFPLSMGQVLSILPILISVIYFIKISHGYFAGKGARN